MVDYKKPVLSIVKRNGLVCENESMFYKIKALINCPKYEAFQPEFYDLDPDNISPELEEKINKMYRKAVASGDITGTDDGEERVDDEFGSDEDDEGFGQDDEDEQSDYDPNPWKSQNFNPAYSMNAQPVGDMPITDIPASGPVTSTFTCLYTALDREGGYKTGKFYSSASSSDTARIDAVSKLAGFGYKNIEIVAVENGSVTPTQMAQGDVGNDIEQMSPEEQAKSEEPKASENDLPTTALEDLTDDEKLQMFNDWFTAFKSTLYDMDVESLSALNDDQKQEFWTRLKTKTIEMSQDPRTFISKSTMDKLETGTFPKNVEAENPVSGETADDDAEVQAALGNGEETGNEPPAPEGAEGPGETGNEPVFNGGADNGGMEEVPTGGEGGEGEEAAPAPAAGAEGNAEAPAPEQNNAGGEEEGEEVVTEDDQGWGDDKWDDFSLEDYLKGIPIDDIPAETEIEDTGDGFEDVPEYEPTEEPPDEEPIDFTYGEMPRRCFYDVVREKNPYNGDGPFADE